MQETYLRCELILRNIAKPFLVVLFLLQSPVLQGQEPEPESEVSQTEVDGGAQRDATTADQTAKTDLPPEKIPTQSFASRSAFLDFELSRDGSFLAIRKRAGNSENIEIVDPDTMSVLKTLEVDEYKRLDWIEWATDTRLIFSISTTTYISGKTFQVSALHRYDVGSDEAIAFPHNEKVWDTGHVIHMAKGGEYALISTREGPDKTPSVFRFNVASDGASSRIVAPIDDVWQWYADNDGVIRMGIGWRKKRLRVYYRETADKKFKEIAKLSPNDDKSRYWDIVQIVSGTDEGYVLEEDADGKVGIRLFNYASGEVVETFYEHPKWDVDAMWVDEDGQPLAAFYTDEREEVVWFDEQNKALYEKLRSELGKEEIVIFSGAKDAQRVLVWAGNEIDPGAVYIHHKESGNTKLLGAYRPAIDPEQLSRPLPKSYEARDGLVISAYLTLPKGREPKNLPLIILPHGGPYGIRDKLDYNDEVQFLANRGYAVFQPNFRGSGGYGKAFYDAGWGQIGRKMQDDLDDAMDWLVKEGIADKDRVCVIGASYGGYAALWAVLRNPERYRCAASWAGVTDFDTMLKYDDAFLTRKAGRRWRQQVRGDRKFDLAKVSPITFADKLSRPLLIAHGSADYVVPFFQYQAFEVAVNDAPVRPKKLILTGEGHSFSSAENEQRWYDALDRFLAKHNPADPVESNSESKVTSELPSPSNSN